MEMMMILNQNKSNNELNDEPLDSIYNDLAVINQICMLNIVDGVGSRLSFLHRQEIKRCKEALKVKELVLEVELLEQKLILIKRKAELQKALEPQRPLFSTSKLKPVK
jgi:hypothetical protein